jgi:hypothetical protein
MPMRGELAIPAMRPEAGATAEHDAWPIIAFCLIGLAMSIYFSVNSTLLDQIPVLIIQANLF